ncbi:uncharacterized protein BDZ99DRAFT_537712 [Mytilinidion resinicola]|uniref:Heterokaryon incompatibility domain-containing protein n=1 Tax=Mytilinidion resinicola TaxID=574789 RepID=A0A6A6YE31_9PEZI|nr:uncharacterized protein BDZ99DRAFT_537712 [Mytilinidion resinicola]KAF2806818.1 hypothetical protein BDZ99DRAFT_537712 [Mytilinidion resinicola]
MIVSLFISTPAICCSAYSAKTSVCLDWKTESALMSSVYGGSTINIAASSAVDSSQGCFMKPPNFSRGLRARITDGGRERMQDFRSSEVYDLSTFQTHLGSRAWALQEKMLPPRTTHFGDRGAFQECRTNVASEYLPDGFPKQLVSPLVRRKGKFEWLWHQLVPLYSAANLTFGKDKLPALSGVARLGFNETGDQYLAGMWRRQIEEQLCWRRWRPKTTLKRPPWRAPSWSWASIDGRVSWRSVEQSSSLENAYAHALDASTTLYGHDPFGQVSSGVVCLACSIVATGFLVSSKTPNNSEGEAGAIVVLRTGNEEQEFPIQKDCLDDFDEENKVPVHLVPILGGTTGMGTYPEVGEVIDELVIQGVVLRGTSVTKGEFSRIGSFNFYKDKMSGIAPEEGDVEFYEPFLKVLKEHGTAAAEAACAEIISNSEHPQERYVIIIV